MAKKSNREPSEATTPELVGQIIDDAQTLVGQQFELLRSELRQEWHKAKTAAAGLGIGVGLVAGGGVLTTLMAVHFLHRHTRLPLWGCYGLVGVALQAAGLTLLESGREKTARVHLIPSQTAEAFKENVEWLKEQATAGAPAVNP